MSAEPMPGGRVAILGSGREGLAAYDYLAAQGLAASLEVITEGRSGRPKEAELEKLGILRTCPFEAAELERFDLLIRSPGVSLYRDSLQRATEAGVRITTPSSIWFQAHPEARTVVVTGTKGKSTTAALLAHLLAYQGVGVRLAGNIGMPLLACDDHDVDWWVIELSSFQLADLEGCPTVGVLLNLDIDHLDWHGSADRYRADKLRLADLVSAGGLIANGGDAILREALEGRTDVTWFDSSLADQALEQAGMETLPASLPGRHSRVNFSACLAALNKIGVDAGQMFAALDTFRGLPHRLQNLGTFGGVAFVDDSISTAPIATVAALEAFPDRQVVLLVGGFERGIDWAPYAREIRAHPPAAVIALPDNGPRIVAELKHAAIEPPLGSFMSSSLDEAVGMAKNIAPEGGVVLLSPGAPSFPHFRDFEDRGRQFAQNVSGGASRAAGKGRKRLK